MTFNDPRRPAFVETIKAFTLTHPDYGKLHTDEEADVAEVLRDVEEKHQGGDVLDGPDSATWGLCSTCRESWPCATWIEAEQLAVIYLGRAHNRTLARARAHMRRPIPPA